MAKFRQIRLPWTLNEQQHSATFRDFKSFVTNAFFASDVFKIALTLDVANDTSDV